LRGRRSGRSDRDKIIELQHESEQFKLNSNQTFQPKTRYSSSSSATTDPVPSLPVATWGDPLIPFIFLFHVLYLIGLLIFSPLYQNKFRSVHFFR
jgi:hypothetical protein